MARFLPLEELGKAADWRPDSARLAAVAVDENYVAGLPDAKWPAYSVAERAKVQTNKKIRLLRDYQIAAVRTLQPAGLPGLYHFLFKMRQRPECVSYAAAHAGVVGPPAAEAPRRRGRAPAAECGASESGTNVRGRGLRAKRSERGGFRRRSDKCGALAITRAMCCDVGALGLGEVTTANRSAARRVGDAELWPGHRTILLRIVAHGQPLLRRILVENQHPAIARVLGAGLWQFIGVLEIILRVGE